MKLELALLGTVLYDPTVLPRVRSTLPTGVFLDRDLALIWEEICEADDRGEAASAALLKQKHPGLEPAISEAQASIIPEWEVASVARHLAETHTRARLEEVLSGYVFNHETMTASAVLDSLERDLTRIRQDVSEGRGETLADLVPRVLEQYQAVHGSAGISGVTSGYAAIDSFTGGWQAGDLIIVAARPGQGKSALAACLAEHAGVPVDIYTLEMSGEQFASRLLCSSAMVPSHTARTGMLTEREWDNIAGASSAVSALPITLMDRSDITMEELRARSRVSVLNGTGLIIVDYLQLMTGDEKMGREREVAKLSRDFKALAKTLGIPIIVLAQLNREVEKRKPPRPQLSDLRESGAIEQDADVVMFLWRPEYYSIGEYEGDLTQGLTEFIIAKHRNGPVGQGRLYFSSSLTRFSDWR